MKELSLFSGAGGGLLGSKLLGWSHVGYVEDNEYCQRIIRQRILDGILENAPIFGDIRAFIDEGYAESYQGLVDVVTAGFPCQPFSVAGKQKGEDDSRNMWPETLAVLRTVRPRYALLENVPGLLAHEYARRIFGDLAESGFNARWRVLSAAEVGASHKRDRVWIKCTNTIGEAEICGNVADTESKFSDGGKLHREYGQCEIPKLGNHGGETTNASSKGLEGQRLSSRIQSEHTGLSVNSWWSSEPTVGRVANGVAHRVDRLKALGNGQVPAVVRAAWKFLVKDENSRGLRWAYDTQTMEKN